MEPRWQHLGGTCQTAYGGLFGMAAIERCGLATEPYSFGAESATADH